ncbi:hypothetical protein DSL92_00725 [Billgrantia gudaonensis]|uniref:Uncharacterized protein n=1 Tax=Billgrantia gudaonensis TaxID=376427 RepID=A0A432JKM9_9GAMM|nr:hypothetical protein DSL92_00725 [Halomonas gudaonensis]
MLGNGRVKVDGEVVARDHMLECGKSYVTGRRTLRARHPDVARGFVVITQCPLRAALCCLSGGFESSTPLLRSARVGM